MDMRKKFVFVFLILALAIMPSVSAVRPHYIYDNANVVDINSKNYINNYGGLIDTATTAEVVVVTLQSLPVGKTVEETKLMYFNDVPLDGVKGIGKAGKDNGVLILLVVDSHDIAIETGYGVEGQLTDAECGRIIREVMIPQFPSNYGNGLYLGMKAVGEKLGYLASTTVSDTTTGTPDVSFGEIPWWWIAVGVIIIAIFFVFMMSNNDDESSWSGGGGSHSSGGGGGGGGFGGGHGGGAGAGGHWNVPLGTATFLMATDAMLHHTPDGTHFCPTCKKDTEYSKVSEYEDEEVKDDGVYKDTHAKYLCLTCGVVYAVTLGSVLSESLADYKARKRREAEQEQRDEEEHRRRQEEEEESRRRRRDEDDYHSHSTYTPSSFGGGSFGGGHSGGGGAVGKW